MHRKFEDLSGRLFGKLIVLKRDFSRKKRTYFICQCSCRKKLSVWAADLKNGHTTTCGAAKHFLQSDSPSWKGCGELSGHFVAHIKCHARNRKIKFNVSIQYLWKLFQKQKRKCNLSGVPISLDKTNRTASLDRIDNKKDYIVGNVQWVHKDINLMKRTLTESQFIDFCQKVVSYKKYD